jgi:hypothetical protein
VNSLIAEDYRCWLLILLAEGVEPWSLILRFLMEDIRPFIGEVDFISGSNKFPSSMTLDV